MSQTMFMTYVLMFLLCLSSLASENGPSDDGVVRVEAGSDVVLPCSLGSQNLNCELFDWNKVDTNSQTVYSYDAGFTSNNRRDNQDQQFKGRISHFEDELQHGNASIMIQDTKVEDSGKYKCYFPRLDPPQTFSVELVVGPRVDRVFVQKGSDAVLPCFLESQDLRSQQIEWKKDEPKLSKRVYDLSTHSNNSRDSEGQQFKGRVSHFENELQHGNASIKIQNTKVEDSGIYTCHLPGLDPPQSCRVQLVFGLTVFVKEDSDAMLPCLLKGQNLHSQQIEWKKYEPKLSKRVYDLSGHSNNSLDNQDHQFKGRVSHFEDELQHGNASIKIQNATVDDSGIYTCYFPRLDPPQIFSVELVVGRKQLASEIPWWGWLLISGCVGVGCFILGLVIGVFSRKTNVKKSHSGDGTCRRPVPSSSGSAEVI